jgi:hypothetical protein
MNISRTSWIACWGLFLFGLAVAPAPQQKAAGKQQALAEARYSAAVKQYDLIWQYYQQNRVSSFDVYVWSRLLLDATRARNSAPAAENAACAEHLDHMTKLEALVKKIRRLGFGRSSDVGASEYYRIEAECWLEEARSR